MLRAIGWLVLTGCLTAQGFAESAETLGKAEELYKHTQYEASLALLDQHSFHSPANFLIGRNYFMMGDFKKATDYFQKAVSGNPTNSEYMDWLGRTYGKRAETSNPFIAPSYASKARQAFEKAVELDGRNSEALSDLFDFYLEAPGFLGGGYDKAQAVAARIAAIDPPEGYYVNAQLDKKRKEFGAAEQQFRKAVAVAPHEVGLLITLAKFLADQGRNKESDAVFQQAEKVKPGAPEVWFARADVLIKQKRNLEEAKELLEKYVKSPVTVDDPPKQEAAKLLKQVQ